MDLFEHPYNPAPSGAILREIVARDGVRLRFARWRATTRRRLGTVCLFQGRAEFIEKYFETIADLRRRGFDVATMDWRGQGGSQRLLANPRKGHVDDFLLYRRDLAAFLTELDRADLPGPRFALAHSMGAAILFHALRERHDLFERVVALAPMVALSRRMAPGFAATTAALLDALGFGANFVPGGGETSLSTKPFAGNRLSTDPVRYARNAALAAHSDLAIGDPTIGWLTGAFRAMAPFADPSFPRAIRTPLLVMVGTDDPVISPEAVERFSAYLKAGRAIIIPRARHELLMERDAVRDQVLAAFDAFVPGTSLPAPQPASSFSASS